MPRGVYPHKFHKVIDPEQRKLIYDEYMKGGGGRAGGPTYIEMAAKYKLDKSTISRIITEGRKQGFAPPPSPARSTPAAQPETLGVGHPLGSTNKYGKYAEQITSMRAQGFGTSEIVNKLGIPRTAVGYYITKLNRQQKSNLEGVSPNGHQETGLDTRFLVGFGCAELERTLTTIAQRLGISPNLLRQGFSKFLGSAALR